MSEQPSRREFLKKAGLTAGGLMAFGAPTLLEKWIAQANAAVAEKGRAFGGGMVALELDGLMVGFPLTVEGGYARAEVITEPVGPDFIVKKHIGAPKYDDITVRFAAGTMSRPWYDWIKATIDMKYVRKGGAVLFLDFSNKEISRLNFFNALITEIGFPALDGSSKDPAMMTIKFAPEYTRYTAGSAKALSSSSPGQKTFGLNAANFRLTIAGLEQATQRVTRIEAMAVKQKVVEQAVSQGRDVQKQPGGMEFPNLVITLSEGHAGPFYAWHEDFVIKGLNSQDRERNGTIELLTPNLQEVPVTIYLMNMGIYKLAKEVDAAGMPVAKVEMYCERMGLTYKVA
jgi:hypothetical protein